MDLKTLSFIFKHLYCHPEQDDAVNFNTTMQYNNIGVYCNSVFIVKSNQFLAINPDICSYLIFPIITHIKKHITCVISVW